MALFYIVIPTSAVAVTAHGNAVVVVPYLIGLAVVGLVIHFLIRRKGSAKQAEFAQRWGLIQVSRKKQEYRGRFGRVEIGVRFLREKSSRTGASGTEYVQVSLLKPRNSTRYVSARARHLRLASHRRASLIEVRTGDAVFFDGRFRVLVGTRDDAAAILDPELRAALIAVSIGTFEYIQGEIRLASVEDPDALMKLAEALCARISA
ncbi:hypothetical protein [Fodinicola feengrottensis]|uniref:hypothetical protein n=1 Tax=Fodinicola feengrottensis TaxID=435914 RepID=UPI0013D0E008|nr:hypothetical protein [Fodinicola feengrottensis]